MNGSNTGRWDKKLINILILFVLKASNMTFVCVSIYFAKVKTTHARHFDKLPFIMYQDMKVFFNANLTVHLF